MYVPDNKYANNYYWFISIQLLLFLLYTRFHLSSVKHQNLRSKVELIANSTKCFKIHLKFQINVVSIFQNIDLLEK